MTTITATIPAVGVTLFEDRAQVRRRGTLALPAGTVAITVDGVAPVISDRHINLVLSGPGQVGISGIRVQRQEQIAASERPAALTSLQADFRCCIEEIAALNAESEAIAQELKHMQAVRQHTYTELSEDAASGHWQGAEAATSLRTMEETEHRLIARRAELAMQVKQLNQMRADLQNQISASKWPTGASYIAAIHITAEVPAAGQYELNLAYLVPNACWRPCHTARLVGNTVHFTTEACIWQRTGEDWADVAITCSTERPSLGTEPPELQTDELRLIAKRPPVIEARQQAIQTAGGAAGKPMEDVPGIDDGGEVRQIQVAASATIPSDGRAHRLPLNTFTTDAQFATIVMAELAPAAILRTTQSNPLPTPILAGPVDLIRSGGIVGRTTMLFVAPGAKFDLGWGGDPEIRVDRSDESHREKKGLMESWPSSRRLVTLRFSNMGREPRTLQVTERTPVSEIDKVTVELITDETRPAARPDADGMLHWTLDLPARSTAEIQFAYRLKHHPDIHLVGSA